MEWTFFSPLNLLCKVMGHSLLDLQVNEACTPAKDMGFVKTTIELKREVRKLWEEVGGMAESMELRELLHLELGNGLYFLLPMT